VTLSTALSFILPPVVGAIIGLFTNWLAIKMLFRPLVERRILGIRVPFTPGILPRERSRMARSMGDTVATDLLDDATVASRLRSPAFKDAIRQASLKAVRKVLEARPAELASGIDTRIVETVRNASVNALAGFSSSEPFSAAIVSGADSAIATSRNAPLAGFIDPAALAGVSAALSGPAATQRIGSALANALMTALERAASDGKRVSAFIDAETVRSFSVRTFESAYPSIQNGVMDFFADRNVAQSMEKAGARLIRRTFDRFNTVQRFFIGLGQYDKAILDNMPATIADFAESVGMILSEESTKAAIAARISSAITALAEKPLSDFSWIAEPEANAAARKGLAEALARAFASMEADSLSRLALDILERQTAGNLLDAFPGLAERIGPALARWAAGLFVGEPGTDSAAGKLAASFFSAFSRTLKEKASDVPLGKTIAVDDEAMEALAATAAEGLAELAADESSNMLGSMDIRSLVIEKIDSLDMIDVERMILKVVDKELGAITLFGGVLGAVIGVFQSLLFLLR